MKKMRSYLLLGAIALFASAAMMPAADAGLDRAALLKLADDYLAAMVAHDPGKAPLARDVKIVENVKRIKPGEGLWKTASAMPSDFKIVAADPITEEVGGLVVMGSDQKPAQVGFRLKLVNGKIVEAEHPVVVLDRSNPMGNPDDPPRSIAPYFIPAASAPKSPDDGGFLQRWLLLEPINKPNRTNTVFTDTYIRNAMNMEYFPNQFTVIPRNGDKVMVAGKELAWHALDSTNFNVKLFRFAYGLSKPTYGVLFWAVTLVDSPREIRNVRMAVGSNSASMWWLNGKEVVGPFGDRRMVMDDCVSKRLTLNKGRNVIRGAVINGPGLSDFCVRFIDENGDPIKDITLSLENTGKQ